MADEQNPGAEVVPVEREKHKLNQRLGNSLGALLSGLGSGTEAVVKKSLEPSPFVADQSSTNDNFKKNQSAPSNSNRGDSSASKKRKLDTSALTEFKDWSETKRYDGDYEEEDIANEQQELDELYGEGIVSIKYGDQGTLGYYCELCYAMVNARKALEMHCTGMRHLKRKDMYKKNKLEGENPLLERRKAETKSDSSGSRGRGDMGSSRGFRDSKFDQDRMNRSKGSYDSYGQGNYWPQGEHRYQDPYIRERDSYDRDRDLYSRGRGGYSAPPWGDQYFGRGDGYDNRYEDPRGYPGYHDTSRKDDKRRSDYGYRSENYGGYPGDALRLSSDVTRSPYSGERSRSPYATDRSRSPHTTARSRSPYTSNRSAYPSSISYPPSDNWGDLLIPSPPPAKPPAPSLAMPPAPAVSVPPSSSPTGFAGGPAAALLTKLSQCTVKNEEDATLASNVINLLLKSLKEYNDKLGEKSVAELMEQAEIKLGTAKAIRFVRKEVTSKPVDAIMLAMNTLRQASAASKVTEFPSMTLDHSMLPYKQ